MLYRTGFRNTIYDVLKSKHGWKQTDSDTDWDFNWADVGWIRENYDHIHMDDHQRVNHFRNHYELTRKDLLVKNVNRMKKQVWEAGWGGSQAGFQSAHSVVVICCGFVRAAREE